MSDTLSQTAPENGDNSKENIVKSDPSSPDIEAQVAAFREYLETGKKQAAAQSNSFEAPSVTEDTPISLPGYEEEITETRGNASRKNKIIGAVSGLALMTGIGAGYAISHNNDKDTAPDVTNSAAAIPGPVETKAPVEVPKEAEVFMGNFGNRYTNPVSTYYAEKAYEAQNGGLPGTIIDSFVVSYPYPNISSGETSVFGLTSLKLSPEQPVNAKSTIELINSSVIPDLNRYMNLLARNPSAEDVINNEFNIYVSPSNPSAKILLETLKGVVKNHGDTAVYTVLPVSNDENNPNTSYVPDFQPTVIDNQDSNGKTSAFALSIENLVVQVNSYDDKGSVTPTQESLKNIQLSFTYDKYTGPEGGADPGYLSVGQK